MVWAKSHQGKVYHYVQVYLPLADQQIRLSVCLIQQVDLAKRGAQIIQYLSLPLSCQAVLGYL